MDTFLNKLAEFYFNNTINLRPLSTLIAAFHTHKMTIMVSVYPMYCACYRSWGNKDYHNNRIRICVCVK